MKNKNNLFNVVFNSKYQGNFKKLILFLDNMGSVGKKMAQILMKGYDYVTNKNRQFSVNVVDKIGGDLSRKHLKGSK